MSLFITVPCDREPCVVKTVRGYTKLADRIDLAPKSGEVVNDQPCFDMTNKDSVMRCAAWIARTISRCARGTHVDIRVCEQDLTIYVEGPVLFHHRVRFNDRVCPEHHNLQFFVDDCLAHSVPSGTRFRVECKSNDDAGRTAAWVQVLIFY